MTGKNETAKVVVSRILSGNKCYYGLLGSLSLSKELKIQFYLIRPIITYRTEKWPLKKMKKRKPIDLDGKILQNIFKPIKMSRNNEEVEEWKIRKNNELKRLFQPNQTYWIQFRVERITMVRSMNNAEIKIRFYAYNNGRKLGRTRTPWTFLFKMRKCGEKRRSDWKVRAADRENWTNGCATR